MSTHISILILIFLLGNGYYYSEAKPTSEGDLVTPKMTENHPGPGKRVKQFAPQYRSTQVYHSLYLPTDWVKDKTYPMLVEYTGNKFPACGSSGEVRDANLGYGLSGGKGFIWVTMPYIQEGKKENAVTWWGDRKATIDYCKENIPRICKQFGGDPENIFICGFSRGAIACSYIGLADEEIAAFWKGMIAHDHFDGQQEWGYPKSDRASALNRLSRLKGRPVLACGNANNYLKNHSELGNFTFLPVPVTKIFDIPDGLVIHPHTDLWAHRKSSTRKTARDWLAKHISPKK